MVSLDSYYTSKSGTGVNSDVNVVILNPTPAPRGPDLMSASILRNSVQIRKVWMDLIRLDVHTYTTLIGSGGCV